MHDNYYVNREHSSAKQGIGMADIFLACVFISLLIWAKRLKRISLSLPSATSTAICCCQLVVLYCMLRRNATVTEEGDSHRWESNSEFRLRDVILRCTGGNQEKTNILLPSLWIEYMLTWLHCWFRTVYVPLFSIDFRIFQLSAYFYAFRQTYSNF